MAKKREGHPPSWVYHDRPEEIIAVKTKVLGLLEDPVATGCWTVVDCARTLGVQAARIYGWMKHDEEFREQTRHAEDIVADILIRRLIDVSPEQQKMAYVTAHIFLIKGLRPRYKESYKIVEPMGQEAREILKEFLEAGKKDDTSSDKLSTPQKEEQFEDNPLAATIKRLQDAEAGQQLD